jgi:hypothetical protein
LPGVFVIINLHKRQQMEEKSCHMFPCFTWYGGLEHVQTQCIFTFREEQLVSAMASGILMHTVLFIFIVSGCLRD